MMLAAFLLLLFLTDGAYSQDNCSYQDVLNYLNLTKNNELYFMTRPVKNYKHSTEVQLEVLLYAILDVINMKRRSVLYIVNFILPVLFFLGLDLASFLISDNGGEKLSFKVTVLLAVTVLQLILNEILPASSNRIPLVAVYCIGIFALMMLSLLETIFVMYLMEKDSASQDSETDEDRSPSEDCRQQGKADFLKCHGEVQWTQNTCIYDGAGETQTELLSVTKEHNSSKQVEEYHALEKVSGELREMEKTLTLLLDSRKEEVRKRLVTMLTTVEPAENQKKKKSSANHSAGFELHAGMIGRHYHHVLILASVIKDELVEIPLV
ncbi:5-hydroxytryptamine receptor 3A-like protein [Lates japonicus]|uniref:5-hydroxytryptamine receptor 3A-like protein n=1 Tax=Lates japonicus TaxID=270547 RepID=A0AAD3RIZ9_LATJO|nr:5-hydroxytryptamine receptor 3A-like protein [Lates japonicus]